MSTAHARGTVRIVVPAGCGDPTRPSGGNVYDRRVEAGLTGLGWEVLGLEAPGTWPQPGPADLESLAGLLARMPDSALVLVDGLVGSAAACVLLAENDRLRLVPLVHMPLDHEREGALLTAVTSVVTTSDWTRRWLVERYGLDDQALHTAEPGVDPAAPAAGSPGGRSLLCVAAVTPPKGHDVLLRALADLTDLEWRCTLVGSLELAPDFVDALRRLTRDAGLADRVDFAGTRGRDDVRAAYADADAVVLASRAETYGMVVTEALAHGLPVVAAAVGGVPEAMGHDGDGARPGLLVRPGDPASLAGALRDWLEDPRLRRRLRRSAAHRRSSLPAWSDTASRVATVLEAAR
ncbi:MAG: glycosyltransferase family 4 protein [Nocardioides sp.]